MYEVCHLCGENPSVTSDCICSICADKYPLKPKHPLKCAGCERKTEAAEVLVEALRRIAEDGPGLFIRSSARCALDEYERRLKDENP